MLDSAAAERWRPTPPLVAVLLALALFLLGLAGAVAALRGPLVLGYGVAPGPGAGRWRVTTVWPSSFAYEAGLRPGTLLRANGPPATQGQTTIRVYVGRQWRTLTLPLRPDAAAALAALALALAVLVFTIGAVTLLFARARRPALYLLLFCLAIALAACGVAAFTRGAPWGSVLFEVCFFALLPPLEILLATSLPPGGRTLRRGAPPLALLGAVTLALLMLGYADVALYPLTNDIAGLVFIAGQVLAVVIWSWRARQAWHGAHRPEYCLVLLGIGGSFCGVMLLAIVPALFHWQLPWPREAAALALLPFPASLSWALLRHRLLDLRWSLRRPVISAVLLGLVLLAGLFLARDALDAGDIILLVLLAGLGVPAAHHAVDRLWPDGRTAYAALVEESGERLGRAVTMEEVSAVLETVRRGLGLSGLSLRRGEAVAAEAGIVDPVSLRLPVRHEGDDLAALDVGEKLRHDDLLAADRQALALLCQHLGAFLARQRLVLRLSDTVTRLEETQERLLTARRLERERLGGRLHGELLQDVLLLGKMLLPRGPLAETVTRIENVLRSILTETAPAALRDLGLPAALRSYVDYLAPHARAIGCALATDIDEAARALAPDTSFALYQLACEALANALKHSGARRIWLAVQTDGAAVTLEVRDDGHGLPPGWERPRAGHRGLGDALDLVRTTRGGVALAESAPDGGTVVRGRVPLRQRAARWEQGERRDPRDVDAVRVLVAASDPSERREVRHMLDEDPRLDIVAETGLGHEVLALVLEHAPAVLLLDLDLSGLCGLDVLRLLQTHVPRPPRTLVLSSPHDEAGARRARESGAHGVLSRDCDGEALRRAVREP